MAEKIGIRPSVIVLNDNKILVIKSQYDKIFYLLPGGGVEFGETVEEAAIRETREETGIIVDKIQLVHVNEYIDFKDKSQRVVNFIFKAINFNNNSLINPQTNDGGKIKEVLWIELKDIDKIDLKPDIIKKCILENAKNNLVGYNITYKNHE